MTNKQTHTNRNLAFIEQRQRCFYCQSPMWIRRPDSYARRFNVATEHLSLFKCTAEHRIARQDGGDDSRHNIVAACWHCNQKRHARPHEAPTALDYGIFVAWAVLENDWLTSQLLLSRLPRRQNALADRNLGA